MQLFLKVEQLMMDAFLFDGCQSPKTWRIEVLTNGLSRFCQCCAQLCFSLFLRRENENLSKKSVSDQVINQFCWAQQFIFLLTTHIFFFFLCIPLLQKSFVSFLRWISIRRKLSKIPLEQKRWNIMIHYWVPKALKVWLEKVKCSQFFLLGLATNLKFVAFLR